MTDDEKAEAEHDTKYAIGVALEALDDLELDVRRALDTGQINNLPLTSAQLVAMMLERRRIIVERCWLEELYPASRGGRDDD